MMWLKVWQLNRQLKDPNALIRERAVRALSDLKHPKAVASLCQALKDSHEDVKLAAAEALRRNPSQEAVTTLLEVLEAKGTPITVQQSILRTLERIGPEAVPSIILRLRDQKCQCQAEMAMLLGKIKSPEALQPLLEAVDDDEIRVRKEAIHALGSLGDKQAVTKLGEMLKDSRWLLRAEACEALGHIGDPQSVDVLIGALQDEKWLVQLSAVKSLGKLADPRSIPALLECGKKGHEDVRAMIAEIIGRLGGPQALSALLEFLRDPETAASAVNGLRQLLTNNHGQLSVHDLAGLAKLEDVFEYRYESQDASELRPSTDIQQVGKRKLDCGPIRQLASQALAAKR